MRAERIYGHTAIALMRLAEQLGEAGNDFIEWIHSGLLAYARHAYEPKTNTVIAMFTDATRITPDDVRRPGYYSKATFEPRPASSLLLLSYAMAYRLIRDEGLMKTVRAIALGHAEKGNADPVLLFAAMELHRATDDQAFLDWADEIARNIMRARFHRGFFVASKDHLNASFNAIEPLALLSLEAAKRGRSEAVPTYNGGQPFIQGPFEGLGRARDDRAIWSVKHDSSPRTRGEGG
jgi:pectate lyase